MTYIITYIPDTAAPESQPNAAPFLAPFTPGSGFGAQQIVAPDVQPDSVGEQRLRFLLFLKILMQHLRDTRNHYLLAKSKLLIKAIVRHNRTGDPDFAELMESIERRLRPLVGEQHWRRAHLLMRYFIAKGGTKATPKPNAQAKEELDHEYEKESDVKQQADEEKVVV